MSDIIDRIDELVEHQLQQERSGYDHNINQDKCWHCGREWHGLPITQRIAQMYARRTYDESYSLAEDDSPILCHGSNFIGPMPAPPRASTTTYESGRSVMEIVDIQLELDEIQRLTTWPTNG